MMLLRAKKSIIFSSVSLLASAIVFVGGLWFLHTKQVDLKELEMKAVSERASIEALKNIELTLKNNFENIENINNYFIKPEEEVDFIKDIELLASSTLASFEIKSFNHKEIPKNEKYEYAVMQAEATGTFGEIYKFLLILEAYPKESKVRQLELQKVSGNSKNNNLWKLSFIFEALKSR